MSINKHKKKIILALIVVLILLLILVGYLILRNRKKLGNDQTKLSPVLNSTPTPEIEKVSSSILNTTNSLHQYLPYDPKPYEAGVKDGHVTITQGDLDYAFGLKYQLTKDNYSDPAKWQTVKDSVTQDTILQNEGIDAGVIPARDGSLNYTDINTAKDYLAKNQLTTISFEEVTIYFNNIIPPSVGIPKAKEIAFQTLSDLHNKVVSGNLTMKQVGDAISANDSLANVDQAYKVNAYSKYDNLGPNDVMIDPPLFKQLWQYKKGDITDILTSKDDTQEYYYTFFKINDIKTTQYASLDELIKDRKSKGFALP